MAAPPWHAENSFGEVVRASWPLLVLAVVIVGGSLYARLIGGIQNTFLNVGLYMLAVPAAAMMMRQTEAPMEMLRGYFRILVVAAVLMSMYLIANRGVRQVYHEQIFLVIPMAALFFVRSTSAAVRWLGCAFFLSMAWFSHKYTSYLIGALTGGYLAFAILLPRLRTLPALIRVTVTYWLCAVMVVGGAIFAYFALHDASSMPTGNPEYRLHTYGAAWNRFVASPFWGTLFAAEAVDKFTLYAIGIANNVLPTHSDIMDMLAHGGILAMALWSAGLAFIAYVAWKNVLSPRFLDSAWAPYAHTLGLMSLAGIITYAFNPVLLQPGMAYLLWTNLGLLLGLSLRATTERDRKHGK
jgi:O-antigen ligase